MLKLDEIQMRLLREVADLHKVPEGAYNIRSNGQSAGRVSTANIEITPKENGSGLDKLEILLAHLPSFVLSTAFFFIRRLEKHGWLPKKLVDLSPFHTSIFVTNMGSMGVSPVYHHVYNLGTLSIFVALGKQYMKNEVQLDGSITSKQMIDVKVVVDERITDGFVYASAFKEMHDIMMHPEVLLEKPETVREDVIDRKPRKK